MKKTNDHDHDHDRAKAAYLPAYNARNDAFAAALVAATAALAATAIDDAARNASAHAYDAFVAAVDAAIRENSATT